MTQYQKDQQQPEVAQATPIVPAPFPSLRWERAIRDLRDVNPMLKFVAYTLKAYADREGGRIRPSLDELKVQTGLSHAQLKRLRGDLVKRGFLELVERGRGRGIAHTSVYRLVLPTAENGSRRAARKRLIEAAENGSSDELPSETQVSSSLPSQGERLTTREEQSEAARAVPTSIEREDVALPAPRDVEALPWASLPAKTEEPGAFQRQAIGSLRYVHDYRLKMVDELVAIKRRERRAAAGASA